MDEQRDYFRIEDQAWVDCRKVKHGRLNHEASDSFVGATEFQLTSELQRIETESAGLLHSLAERDVELANYLRTQNQKIDLLARTFIEFAHGEEQNAQAVTLSEVAISFYSEETFAKGQWLALRIMLQSEPLLFHCFAEVRECNALESRVEITADFGWRDEEQRDLLAKHIFRQQAKQRREQRNSHV